MQNGVAWPLAAMMGICVLATPALAGSVEPTAPRPPAFATAPAYEPPLAQAPGAPALITHLALSTAATVALHGVVLGGTAATLPVFLGLSLGAVAATHLLHEQAWTLAPPEALEGWRGTAQAVTAGIAGFGRDFGIGIAYAGNPVLALTYASASGAAGLAISAANRMGWQSLVR